MDSSIGLELARSQAVLLEVVATAKSRAKAAYDTGDRERQRACMRDHLQAADTLELMDASHYHCPQCGHCLKRRDTEPACDERQAQ